MCVHVCLGNINQSSEIPCTIFVSWPMPIFACGSSTKIVHLSTSCKQSCTIACQAVSDL